MWLGTDALKKGLCDKLSTSDDVILSLKEQGMELYKLEHSVRTNQGLNGLIDDMQGSVIDSIIMRVSNAIADRLTNAGNISNPYPLPIKPVIDGHLSVEAGSDATKGYLSRFMAVDTSISSQAR